MREEFELVDTIILNGVIDYCSTNDENTESIGIKVVEKSSI